LFSPEPHGGKSGVYGGVGLFQFFQKRFLRGEGFLKIRPGVTCEPLRERTSRVVGVHGTGGQVVLKGRDGDGGQPIVMIRPGFQESLPVFVILDLLFGFALVVYSLRNEMTAMVAMMARMTPNPSESLVAIFRLFHAVTIVSSVCV
jgi:hypothetical protein